MLAPVYDARTWTPGRYAETVQSKDYSDEQEARAAVEAAGEGQLIKFARTHNLPGALPPVRLHSIWLETYSAGTWKKVNIHC
jgi:hypothetical protein